MRLLIVEDDQKIALFLKKGLQEAGYVADCIADGEEGYRRALEHPYDAAVVDLMLPGRDGLSLIEGLRQRGVRTPVLILSARRSVDDRVRGLQSGGDDYLVKPFAFVELLARIQALIRRNTGVSETAVLAAGPLTLNLVTRTAARAGEVIELQPLEFRLLQYLMATAGRVVSRTMIMEHVWDLDFDPQTNVVEVLVHRLRSKIDQNFEPKLLQTVRGVGYVLRIP